MIRGEISPRVALALVAELPMESRTKAAIRGGDEYLGWTQDRYINVAIFNILQQLLYVQTTSKTKSKVPRPKPMPVPDKTEKKVSQDNEFSRMLARAKANKEKSQGE